MCRSNLSALDSQFDPIDPEGSLRRVAARLRPILRAAKRQRAHVHVDMESYRIKDLTLYVFQNVLMEDEFRDLADVGIVIQCYLHDAEADLVALRDWARRRGTPVWVRLVKGAYWDYETVHARATGWPIPVFQEKWQSDANFERCTRFVMLNHEHLRPALGSHNVRSLAHGIAVAQHLGLAREAFELQMLYGMADAEKQAIVDAGYRLRIYMPYGELIPGMAYLVRRLLENTSNDSFLRASFTEQVAPEVLLMNPVEHPDALRGRRASEPAAEESPIRIKHPALRGDLPPFRNEPPTDFAIERNRKAMREALAGSSRAAWAVVSAGDPWRGCGNPGGNYFSQSVGSFGSGGHGGEGGSAACRGGGGGGEGGAGGVEFARGASAGGFSAGSGGGNAAAAVRAGRLGSVRMRQGVARSGWGCVRGDRFLRILCPRRDGAGAIAGSGCARRGESVHLHAARRDGGDFAVEFSAGDFDGHDHRGAGHRQYGDHEAGGAIERDRRQADGDFPRDRFAGGRVAISAGARGSGWGGAGGASGRGFDRFHRFARVGLAINAKAAEVSARGIGYVKHVICEMGGKNAIIVDDDADLDEAVLGVVRSAFGYQGQKCSACSRCIVLSSIYDAFLTRLVEATRSLKVGPADDPATSVGPVIDAESVRRIQDYIQLGRKEAREVLAVDVGPLAQQGFFVGPHIFADVKPDSRLAQEEIFGPVLAVIRAGDLSEAIGITNSTDYALTGGIFSRSPAHLDRACREMMVGNLYLNRAITGALVGRQPFGGFKLSGIGSKAGGPDYLLQFVLPRTITENTLRRGFAPVNG